MVAIIIFFVRIFRYKNLTLQNRLEAIGLMAGLLVTALHSFVDFHFYIVAILMVMGFICARIQEISENYFSGLIRDLVPSHKLSRKIFMLVAVVLPFVILSYSLPMAIGNFYRNKANEYLENGQAKNGELTLERAASWNPESIGIRFQQFSLFRSILQIVKSDNPPSVRKDLFAKALLILNKIESINPLMGAVHENRGHLLIENVDIVVGDGEEKAILEFKKALQLNPRLYRSRVALAKLLEQRGELNEAVLLMNDGIRYYYHWNLTGLDEYYQYAIKLNLMNGDTIKAREIQLAKSLLPVNQ
jgi:tetratricopeptide (TPR) repeat protein